ncbi:alkaline shock response membrane anchor protein AmaP [Desulfotruncus alcoholivorax]|uniref:alkaline shock response membrane anchor protein AmaP n=1 Tax=Desulfotruncus alcoholivorax TaxID=265477 RepID=UPI00040FEE3F|nr:alkaline shock response membrane anchor protein AmaP [Desulfotruncus alcoholivorax]
MGPFDRGILAIYSITLTLLGLVAVAFMAGWQEPWLRLWREISLPDNREVLWALVAVYIIMGSRLVWKSIRGEHKKKQAVVHERSLGEVRVSLPAIESLAEKEAYNVEGVREARARVGTAHEGISVKLKVTVTPDISVPQLSECLQQQVKDRVHNVVGITVHEVRVAVESFSNRKSRVE